MRIGGADGCSPKACNDGMCSMVKEQFCMHLQESLQNTMSCLKWHHFPIGSVGAVQV